MDNWLEVEGGNYVAEMLKENCYITHVVSHILLVSKYMFQCLGV